MKFSPFKFILFSLFIVFLTSCLGTTDTVTTSTDPSFKSMTFAADDSVSGIAATAFTLEYDPIYKDSIIVNLDSMVYKADINDVIATLTFKSSAAIYRISGTDTVGTTATDTIDFTKPIKFRNYATDKKTFREYWVKVNVHQVEPKLYNWSPVVNAVGSGNVTNQKSVFFKDQIFYYSNDGTGSYLYTSTDGTNWTPQTVTGLPTGTPLNDITEFNGKLYLAQDGFNIYSSVDGKNWTKFVSDYNFKSMLYVLSGKLWAVVQSTTESFCRFASYTETDGWVVRGQIPANFPVRDFTSLSFASRTGQPKVLVIGGYSASDAVLKTRWSSEDGVYWTDFSVDNHTLDTLAVGASVIEYGDKLLLFGVRSDKAIYTNHYRVSIDEGFSWQTPDTLYNRLRLPIKTVIAGKDSTIYTNYQPRNYQSVVVMNPHNYTGENPASSLDAIQKSNRIFIIGGKTNTEVLTDVWTGKLNKKNFLRQ